MFTYELMQLLRQAPSFTEHGLKPHGLFMPSFKLKHKEYCIVNKIDHVIIKPKYWYHDDGSYSVSSPPPKTFYNVHDAYDYLMNN
jgi:hypothetical protein